VLQIECEARYSHYVSKLLWYNRSKLDSSFRQRVARMAGAQLAQQQPSVAAGERRTQCSTTVQANLFHKQLAGAYVCGHGSCMRTTLQLLQGGHCSCKQGMFRMRLCCVICRLLCSH
jgi:hypothetical protein